MAARVLGATPTDRAPAGAARDPRGAVAAFVGSLNELVVTLFLATPTTETFPAVVRPQLRYAASPLVAVASRVGVAATLLGAGVAMSWIRTAKRQRAE